VAIVDYGVVRFSHTINKGGQDLSMALSRSLNISFAKAEEIKRQVGLVEAVSLGGEVSTVISPLIEYVFSEINHAIVNYQKKHQRAVEKIIFIGGGAQLPGLVAAAGKTIEPAITIGTPFDKVETPAFLEPILKSAGPSFAVALGLALRQLEG
jgi:type IV pilus assembly protein PilM